MAFQVGDEVAIYAGHWNAYTPKISRIKRVMTRFLELEDGSRWNLNGFPYPRQKNPTVRRSITKATPQILLEYKKTHVRDEILALAPKLRSSFMQVPLETLIELRDTMRKVLRVDGEV